MLKAAMLLLKMHVLLSKLGRPVNEPKAQVAEDFRIAHKSPSTNRAQKNCQNCYSLGIAGKFRFITAAFLCIVTTLAESSTPKPNTTIATDPNPTEPRPIWAV